MQPLIITAAITGAETTKEMNPNLPVTPEEQAADAAACVAAGASIIHLHVRDDAGKPSQALADFRQAITAVRAACSPMPIVQISTGGAVGEAMEKRVAPIVELEPEMASLNIASMNFGDDIFLNAPQEVRALAERMRALGVMPEIEVYDVGHIEIAKSLLRQGIIAHPIHYQFVLGVPGGLSGEPRNLQFMVDSIDREDTWGVAGIGRYELPCSVIAVAMGGFVRVGFEDNIYYRKGELATSNAQLVARIARVAEEVGRPVASPTEARKMLGIAG